MAENKNAGVSLIEVIVIVLILGILASATVIGINVAHRSDASKTADKLIASLDLTREQSMAMVAGQLSMRIQCKADGSYEVLLIQNISGVETILSQEDLCSANLTLSYDDGTGEVILGPGTFIDLSYQKSSGAFTGSYQKIYLTGTKRVSIVLVKETGRSYMVQ